MLLYTHIPFCESRCHYCSFVSQDFGFEMMEEYFDAIKKQFLFEVDRLGLSKNSIETLYIGGGTPSLAPALLFERYLEVVSPYLKSSAEFSCEANPNSLTKEWLKDMKTLGLNRLSIGVQSFNEEKLKFLGRIHTAKDALYAVLNAKSAGIEDVSIDLIYESAVDNMELLQNDIESATSLQINHISAYSLTIENNSSFEGETQKALKSDEQAYFLRDFLGERGFVQYEVSNFGKECVHNIGYWKHKPYLGVGAGAVGFVDDTRRYCQSNTKQYINNPTFCKLERLTERDIKMEKVFLGLRSSVGFEKNLLLKKELERLDVAQKSGKVEIKNEKIFATDMFEADSVTLFLLQ